MISRSSRRSKISKSNNITMGLSKNMFKAQNKIQEKTMIVRMNNDQKEENTPKVYSGDKNNIEVTSVTNGSSMKIAESNTMH